MWGLEWKGREKDPVGARENERGSVLAHLIVCNLCPAVSCLSNRMTSMRKWNYGAPLSIVLMLGALCMCLCMLGRDDDLSEPAGYELCLPNRPTAAGLQWCGPYTHLLSLQAGMLFLISDFIALPQWAHQEEHAGGQSLQQRSDLVKSSSSCDEQLPKLGMWNRPVSWDYFMFEWLHFFFFFFCRLREKFQIVTQFKFKRQWGEEEPLLLDLRSHPSVVFACRVLPSLLCQVWNLIPFPFLLKHTLVRVVSLGISKRLYLLWLNKGQAL